MRSHRIIKFEHQCMRAFFSFQVPEKSDFLQTFDIFFKMFKVFILEYSPKYASMMNFFGRFVYETQETTRVCPRLWELKNDIFDENNNVQDDVQKS